MSVKGEKSVESINIGTLFKFIKPFDGSRDKLNSFISICQSAIDLATDGQQPILLKFILSQLEGKAETACSIKEFDDWDQLSEFLKSQFGETKHYAHLLSDLQECHQLPNELVSQFALRLETCLSKLLTEVTLSNKKKYELAGRLAAMEDLALHTFLLGLKPNISNLVRGKNPTTLNSAINFATSEEKIQRLLYRRNTHTSQQNSTPNRPLHKTNGFRPIIHNVNNEGHSVRFQPHNSNQLPNILCRYCKNQGHTIETCKKRQYNNTHFKRPTSQFSSNQPQQQNSNQFQQNKFTRNPSNNQSARVHFVNDCEPVPQECHCGSYLQEDNPQEHDSQEYYSSEYDSQEYVSQDYDSQEYPDDNQDDNNYHLNN